ncbi:uncharacterized protein LOC129021698 isoform X1 [Pongo pygmaeus]|uniref:uncharacterized protein LOC129021698 isoform X1 n=1 Tax=Pongo pygmaeus TaxID=9600 RepID=UPI00300CB27A
MLRCLGVSGWGRKDQGTHVLCPRRGVPGRRDFCSLPSARDLGLCRSPPGSSIRAGVLPAAPKVAWGRWGVPEGMEGPCLGKVGAVRASREREHRRKVGAVMAQEPPAAPAGLDNGRVCGTMALLQDWGRSAPECSPAQQPNKHWPRAKQR